MYGSGGSVWACDTDPHRLAIRLRDRQQPLLELRTDAPVESLWPRNCVEDGCAVVHCRCLESVDRAARVVGPDSACCLAQSGERAEAPGTDVLANRRAGQAASLLLTQPHGRRPFQGAA